MKRQGWYHKNSTLNTNTTHGIKQGIQNYNPEISKQRSQEVAEFPISHPLEVALQQNSNKVV